MSLPSVLPVAAPRRQRRHGIARWWLAGLLVSCLLPAGLGQTDTLRIGERVVSVCFWMPAILRARSHWFAKRRKAHPRSPVLRILPVLAVLLPPAFGLGMKLPMPAAHDVLTQRGPPVST